LHPGFPHAVVSGQAEEYQRRHAAIWPELRTALLDAGIVEYRIFHDDNDDALFAVLYCSQPDRLAELPSLPVMQQWWAYMADIMATMPDLAPVQRPLHSMFVLSTGRGRHAHRRRSLPFLVAGGEQYPWLTRRKPNLLGDYATLARDFLLPDLQQLAEQADIELAGVVHVEANATDALEETSQLERMLESSGALPSCVAALC
jgi:L-rhamnose mutarotase